MAEEYYVHYSKSTMFVMKRCSVSEPKLCASEPDSNQQWLKTVSFFFRTVFSTLWFVSRLSLLRFIFELGKLALHPCPFRSRQYVACWCEVETGWQLPDPFSESFQWARQWEIGRGYFRRCFPDAWINRKSEYL